LTLFVIHCLFKQHMKIISYWKHVSWRRWKGDVTGEARWSWWRQHAGDEWRLDDVWKSIRTRWLLRDTIHFSLAARRMSFRSWTRNVPVGLLAMSALSTSLTASSLAILIWRDTCSTATNALKAMFHCIDATFISFKVIHLPKSGILYDIIVAYLTVIRSVLQAYWKFQQHLKSQYLVYYCNKLIIYFIINILFS